MSEFEKEFNKTFGSNSISTFNIVKEHFKYWQPPKQLVVVPQFVADWFEEKMSVAFSEVVSAYSFSGNEVIAWVYENGGIDLLCKMKLYGYTVEKEKLYYLKHIDISRTNPLYDSYLSRHDVKLGTFWHQTTAKNQKPELKKSMFTQEEIYKLQTGSYEQIEVE
jgi:Protein of unknown function (DUF1642).